MWLSVRKADCEVPKLIFIKEEVIYAGYMFTRGSHKKFSLVFFISYHHTKVYNDCFKSYHISIKESESPPETVLQLQQLLYYSIKV